MSMRDNVLDRLDQQAREDYRQLCIKLAEGDDPSAEEVQRVLNNSGRTRADLRADVNTLSERKRAHDRLQSAADAELKRIDADREYAEAKAAHEKLFADTQRQVSESHQALKAKFQEVRELTHQAAGAHGARAELQKTASKQATGALASLRMRRSGLLEQVHRLADRLDKGRVFNPAIPGGGVVAVEAEADLKAREAALLETIALYKERGDGEAASRIQNGELFTVQQKLAKCKALRAELDAAQASLARVDAEISAAEQQLFDWRCADLNGAANPGPEVIAPRAEADRWADGYYSGQLVEVR